jgi:hypothetical protein
MTMKPDARFYLVLVLSCSALGLAIADFSIALILLMKGHH